MVDQDIILEKVNNIQNCLKRIHEKTHGDPAFLEDFDIQDIFVLNLQRAIQATIDLAAHIIKDEGLGLPGELKENFILLEKAKIINKKLSEKMQNMVGFRNIAIHDYSRINIDILKAILAKHILDFEEFYKIVLKKYQIFSS